MLLVYNLIVLNPFDASGSLFLLCFLQVNGVNIFIFCDSLNVNVLHEHVGPSHPFSGTSLRQIEIFDPTAIWSLALYFAT
jgi:hypothetical protein